MFYQKIEQMCASKGITLRKMENDILTNGLVGKWRDGVAKPSLATLNKIANYLECDVHELVDAVLEDTAAEENDSV